MQESVVFSVGFSDEGEELVGPCVWVNVCCVYIDGNIFGLDEVKKRG
jgi:O-phosphoseryl-tRNA(Cys) synthetase